MLKKLFLYIFFCFSAVVAPLTVSAASIPNVDNYTLQFKNSSTSYVTCVFDNFTVADDVDLDKVKFYAYISRVPSDNSSDTNNRIIFVCNYPFSGHVSRYLSDTLNIDSDFSSGSGCLKLNPDHSYFESWSNFSPAPDGCYSMSFWFSALSSNFISSAGFVDITGKVSYVKGACMNSDEISLIADDFFQRSPTSKQVVTMEGIAEVIQLYLKYGVLLAIFLIAFWVLLTILVRYLRKCLT